MRVARSSALAGLLLVAAGAAYGAEATGTLDETKQELRQLQSDQKNKAGQNSDKLKLATPGTELQLQDSDSSAAWLADKLKKEKKLKEREKTTNNWLVEGVEKLEKEESETKGTNNAGPKEAVTTQAAPHAIDQSDPQYLLKLFDEQKKPADNKSTAGKSSTSAQPDAFAPFMKSWLGSSPVRGEFFDQFARKPDGSAAGGSPVPPVDYHGPAGSAVTPVGGRDPIVADKGNPYLTELNAPILTKEVTGEATQLQSMGAPLLAPEAAGKGGPVLLPSDPAPDNRDRPKTTLPGLADEKKYFPQLKRF